MYTEKVLDHFLNPRNLGVIPDADGIGQYGDPACGDFLRVYIKVENGRLKDVKFLIQGCPAAIATSSIMTELATGKTIEEALKITDDDILEAIGVLPEEKAHCSNLGAGALHLAVMDYLDKQDDSKPAIG
ncbi:Iron-sulfur cluster assembly scaffold protein IscU [Koleobacter methoxysyntrophicus]|jgi:nitrogen fixation NifU-like protein|uniref:Iron-sulfur cluster assembly scaffold protein IscU n=2 Tax=Bacillota TaxID=1239 RepID=A0A8A0RNG4_9FIRM|nr:iron-sulfur cluster assembly scaffold protein [Koleobacter methoxysyntrophicus]QSQ09128.1 Iron-sulfur cluster assembly scaffold protein IscU [Koleobacter methoxysyntrophicus]